VSAVENSGSVRLRKIKGPGGSIGSISSRSSGAVTGHGCGARSVQHGAHDSGTLSVPVLVLLATGRPWVVWWVGDPADRRLETDVCLPPEGTEGGWRYVDLEVDPVPHERDSRVEIEGWEQYEQACRNGRMSADDAKLAQFNAEDRAESLRCRAEPRQGADGRYFTNRRKDSLATRAHRHDHVPTPGQGLSRSVALGWRHPIRHRCPTT
jgi:hypothetical protein